MPDGGLFLTRYADLVAVYKDAATFTSDKKREFAPKYGDDAALRAPHDEPGLQRPAAAHARAPPHRRRPHAARHRGHGAAPRRRWSTACSTHGGARRGRRVDLIDDFAAAMPVEVIGNLLAVPREERAPLRDWSLAILGALEPVLTPAQQARGNARRAASSCAYLRRLVAAAAPRPGDPERDVLTRLIAGRGGRRAADRARAAAQQHLHPQRRPRDHHQPDRQRPRGACSTGPSEKARLLAEPELIAHRGRGVPALSRAPTSSATGSRTAAAEIGGVALAPRHLGDALHRRRQPRPGAVRRSRPARHRAARPTGTWPSAPASTQCVGMGLARLEGRIAIGRFLARFPRYGSPARRCARGAPASAATFACPVRLQP